MYVQSIAKLVELLYQRTMYAAALNCEYCDFLKEQFLVKYVAVIEPVTGENKRFTFSCWLACLKNSGVSL